MLFSSFSFIAVFLPIALLGFSASTKLGGPRLAAGWLVIASLFFYGWWNPVFVPLLCLSIASNNIFLRIIRCAGNTPRVQAGVLVAAIAANLAALVYFKYLAAVLAFLQLHGLARAEIAAPLLPLGISFFTFTQIGLLIDTRAGLALRTGLLDHALFVTFFPHVIAGPVLHHREIMPQLADPATYRLRAENIAVGCTIFALGLVKKTVCADGLSGTVSAAFADPLQLGAIAAWQGSLAYALQLYFDFSGYSDMAIGLARLFGIRFPANFNSPYKAQSVIDYWQRWHITLTRYLTLYVYTPLALRIARRRAARGLPTGRGMGMGGFLGGVAAPTLLTMVFAGVWHGAGLTFLVFGALHGFYLTANHAWRVFRPSSWKPRQTRLRIAGRILATFLCVLVGAVLFRSATLASARDMLAAMAGLHGAGTFGERSGGAVLREWALIGVLGAIAFGAPNTQTLMRAHAPVLGSLPGRLSGWVWQPRLGWALLTGVLGAVGLLGIGGSTEFLYFAF
jgi:alginate O-acetyltransferase complex protein AlgI